MANTHPSVRSNYRGAKGTDAEIYAAELGSKSNYLEAALDALEAALSRSGSKLSPEVQTEIRAAETTVLDAYRAQSDNE